MTVPGLVTNPLEALEKLVGSVIVSNEHHAIVWVNQAAADMLGYTREALIGRTAMSLFAPEEVEKHPLRVAEIDRGVRVVAERRMLRADGTRIDVELGVCRLSDDHHVCIARDVTARASTIAALERSEQTFRSLIDKLPDVLVIHRFGKIVYVNQVAVEMLGYDHERELLGRPVFELVAPESRAQVARRVENLREGVRDVPWVEEKLLHKDGSAMPYEIGGIAIMFGGEPAVCAIARDISERKQLYAQLAQADKMASLGTLAAGIAHEINNPLAYAALNLERAQRMIAALGPEHATLANLLTATSDGIARVGKIVSGLQSFARAEEASGGPSLVEPAIDAALRLSEHPLRLRASIVRDVETRAAVGLSEGQLTQVLVNLFANATQAIPPGHAAEHAITIRCRDVGAEVRIDVIDTGAGMTAEQLAHIFEPFFTTKAPGAGTGLGLAICHGIVTRAGGRIEAASTSGRGTTMTVVLPTVAAAPVEEPAAEPHAPEPSRAGSACARILVIEDEAAIRTVLGQILADEMYQVDQAASGRAAIDKLAQNTPVDLILCDMTMPDLSGIDVYRWIEAHRADLCERVIFISGGGQHELAERFTDRFIAKPFKIDAMLQIISERLLALATA